MAELFGRGLYGVNTPPRYVPGGGRIGFTEALESA
jgi:hypothetical protein